VFVRYGRGTTAAATYADDLTPVPGPGEAGCDGLCVTGADIGVPGYGVAYPHPGCPAHDPGEVCACGMPDRCLSPSHGQISMEQALAIRHRQERGEDA
jgi:hypothetical protein